MSDILDDLLDIHKLATTERSHYYVAGTTSRAIEEITELRCAVRSAKIALNKASLAAAERVHDAKIALARVET